METQEKDTHPRGEVAAASVADNLSRSIRSRFSVVKHLISPVRKDTTKRCSMFISLSIERSQASIPLQ